MRQVRQQLTSRYADLSGARAAWLIPAHDTVDALAKIGLIGAADHLVVFADDFEPSFRVLFRWGNVTFVNDPLPGSFLAASGQGAAAARDVSPLPAPEPVRNGAAGSADAFPASYAHPAGFHARRTYWFVSSIGGLGLRVPNIRLLGQAALSCGATLIVDNTVPSSFGCEPLRLGAHIMLEALDRVAAGRLRRKTVAVSVAQAVSGRGRKRIVRPEAEDAYRLLSFGLGAPGDDLPDCLEIDASDLGALDSGLASLGTRMQRHADDARALAEYLACHPLVGHVFYPGLKSHADHAIASNVLLHGYGPAIDIALRGSGSVPARTLAQALVDVAPCAHRDVAAGGRLTRMSVVGQGDAAVARLFAGTDDPLQVIDDLERAFHRLR